MLAIRRVGNEVVGGMGCRERGFGFAGGGGLGVGRQVSTSATSSHDASATTDAAVPPHSGVRIVHVFVCEPGSIREMAM